MSDYRPCFGCGAQALDIEGECHKYMLSSPGCWTMFCEIMDREFSDLRYWKGHQYTVDAYAVQHAGKKEDQRAVNSVYIHLAALHGFFVEGLTFDQAPKLRGLFSQYYKQQTPLPPLELPPSMGELTIFELWDNEEPERHFELAERWARSAWEAWSHQHERIAYLIRQARG